MVSSNSSGPSLGRRAVAILVLLVAAWIAFQIVKGFVVAVFWTGAAVLAVIAIFWALRVLRSD
jgi:hypothetical protein